MSNNSCCVTVERLNESAVIPTRGTTLSVGYDITAIGLYKRLSARTALYHTGIRVCPPEGYYVEIIPRSSLSKTGYMLSNSVGTIDPDYRGELLIALTKVDDSLPDLEFPFCRCQMVLRKCEYYNVVEGAINVDTERGNGGFGSTDANVSNLCSSTSGVVCHGGVCRLERKE